MMAKKSDKQFEDLWIPQIEFVLQVQVSTPRFTPIEPISSTLPAHYFTAFSTITTLMQQISCHRLAENASCPICPALTGVKVRGDEATCHYSFSW